MYEQDNCNKGGCAVGGPGVSSFVHLPKLAVAEDVCKVFHHQWGTMKQGWLNTTTCESYFVRLSPEDLQQMLTTVGSNSRMEQVPSKFSIITRDGKFYYKELVFVEHIVVACLKVVPFSCIAS